MKTHIKSFILTFFVMSNIFGVYDSVATAKNIIENMSLSSFRNKEAKFKTAYLDNIEVVNNTLHVAENETELVTQNKLYMEALKVVHTMIRKTDGCVKNSFPDAEDWVISYNDASVLYTALTQLSDDIKLLINVES